MFLGEPPPTQGDLHFRVFGFPVRVHPFFWVSTLILGMGGGEADPVETLIWIGVVFVSILVHELGHAFMQRRYGGRPWVTLYGLGGLASCNDCDRSPRAQIIISLAGPVAGFLLAGLVILLVRLSGHAIGFARSKEAIDLAAIGMNQVLVQTLVAFCTYFEPFASRPLNVIVWDLLQVNILWGLVNLLPVYPLDGGRIARELFTLGNPRQGIVQSLQLSTGVAVLIAVYAVTRRDLYLCLMFGLLAYGSYQALQAYRNHWR
jgi:stage IV sporulation protein FB